MWDNEASIELYIDAGKNLKELNKKCFDQLIKYKEQIENKFGDSLSWERLDLKRASRVAYKFPNRGLRNKTNWDSLQSEMIDKMMLLEAAFSPYIADLDVNLI